MRGSDAFQMVLLVEARGGYLSIKGRRRGVREREDNKEIFLNLIFLKNIFKIKKTNKFLVADSSSVLITLVRRVYIFLFYSRIGNFIN